MDMPSVVALVLVMSVMQPGLDAWIATLGPLVTDARKIFDARRVTVEPGTLPPSPITGRSAALFAVRIGVDSFDMDEDALATLDRLVDAHAAGRALSSADRAVVGRWVDELRRRVLADLAARRQAVACDDGCVRQHLQTPAMLFGGPADQRAGKRDRLLLETLSHVVQTPPGAR